MSVLSKLAWLCSLLLMLSGMWAAGKVFFEEPELKAPVPGKTVKKTETAPLSKKQARISDYTRDRKWSRSYPKEADRTVRFSCDRTRPGFRKMWLEWKGGEYIAMEKLEAISRTVLKRMPHIGDGEISVKLLVETAIAESMAGYYVNPKGGDLGVFQIREEVASELLDWLKAGHPDIYRAIGLFRDEKRNLRENLMENVPFGAAVAIVEYWRKAGADYEKHAKTLRGRAEMWKSVYNSRKGAGTVADYEKRVADYRKLDSGSRRPEKSVASKLPAGTVIRGGKGGRKGA